MVNRKEMINKCFLVFLVFLFSVSAYSQHERHYTSMISGRVISTEKEVVDFATVYLKGTNYGSYTNEKGIYHLKTVEGEYILVVSAVGYQTVEKKVKLAKGERIQVNVTIAPKVKELGEVVVTTSGVGRVNKSAFNAVAVDAKKLHNSTQTLRSYQLGPQQQPLAAYVRHELLRYRIYGGRCRTLRFCPLRV